jgi:hypothetical protein
MIAEMLILLPLVFKKGGGNGLIGPPYESKPPYVHTGVAIKDNPNSPSNMASGYGQGLVGQIETISQSFTIPTFDYTTAYIEGAKGLPTESIEMKLKGGRL